LASHPAAASYGFSLLLPLIQAETAFVTTNRLFFSKNVAAGPVTAISRRFFGVFPASFFISLRHD